MIGAVILFFFRVLILAIVGVMAVLGFIICAPFPSFWREAMKDAKD